MAFLIGSSYFFSIYSDYVTKDIDKIQFVNSGFFEKELHFHLGKEDIFIYKKFSPDEFIELTLKSQNPMQAGKFLIPEVCKEIGFTLEHLKQLKQVFDKMDNAHKYEKIIYDAYIENNDFTLTEEQKLKAYKEYKKYRENK